MSVCAQKVRLVLHEKGQRPALHHLNLRTGDQLTPEYLALNPNGVVPTLVVDGRPIIESTLICEYLDDAFPDPPLRPTDLVDRAAMRRWAWIPDLGLHAACGAISFGVAFREQMLELPADEIEANIAATPDPARRERKRQSIEMGIEAPVVRDALQTYTRVFDRIEAALADGRQWLLGEQYTLADAGLTPYAFRIRQLHLTPMLDGRPHLSAWLERLCGRPNFAGISDYIVPAYVALMDRAGPAAAPRIGTLLEQSAGTEQPPH